MNRRNMWILTAAAAITLFLSGWIWGITSEASEAPTLSPTTSAEIGESFVLRLGFNPGSAEAENLTLKITKRSGEATVQPTGNYFLISLDPEELTVDLKPRLMNGTEEADRRTTPYSGALYAKALAESGLADDSVKVMLADLLEYGAAAQDYFNYRTEDKANGTAYQWTGYAPSAFTAPTAAAALPQNAGEGVYITSANLYLEGDTIAVQFKGKAPATATYTLEAEGESAASFNETVTALPVTVDGNGEFTVKTEAIKMSLLVDAAYTFTVADGANTSEITYAIANYIANKTSAAYEASGNPYMLALAKRLWAYGGSAKAVKDERPLTGAGANTEDIWGPLW